MSRRWLVAVAAVTTVMTFALPTASQAAGPATDIPPRLQGKTVEHLPTTSKVVALTFDGGAGAAGLPSILATLKAEAVPATFFLTGQWVHTFPGQARRIAQRGYPIGNHTYSHPKVTTLSDAALRRELRRTERAIADDTGSRPGPWFRFPYGAHTPADIRRVNALGYVAIQWTVDTAGWLGTSGGQSVNTVVARVLKALRPGAIVLMHVGQHPTDGSTLDADALPRLIRELRGRGYSFTTLAALLPAAPSP